MPQNTVRLHPLAERRLNRLIEQLQAEEGHKATRQDVVAALVSGVTPAQAAGMLLAFQREAAADSPTADRDAR